MQWDAAADLRCECCKNEGVMTCFRAGRHWKCMRCVLKRRSCRLNDMSDLRWVRHLFGEAVTDAANGQLGAEGRMRELADEVIRLALFVGEARGD